MADSILDKANELLAEMKASRDALGDYDAMGLGELKTEDQADEPVFDESVNSLNSIDIERAWIEAERLLGRLEKEVGVGCAVAGPMIAMMNASHQMTQEGEIAPIRRLLRFLGENGEHSAANEDLWSAVDMARAERRVTGNPDPETHLNAVGLENTARAIGLRSLFPDGATQEDIEQMIADRSAPLPVNKDVLREFGDVIGHDYGGVGIKAAGRKIAAALDFIISKHFIEEECVAINEGRIVRFSTSGGAGVMLMRLLVVLCPAIVGHCTIGKTVPLLGCANIAIMANKILSEDELGRISKAKIDAEMIPMLSTSIRDADAFIRATRNIKNDWLRKTRDLPNNVVALSENGIRDGFFTSASIAAHSKRTDRWARSSLAQLLEVDAIVPLVKRSRFRIYTANGLPALIEKYGMW